MKKHTLLTMVMGWTLFACNTPDPSGVIPSREPASTTEVTATTEAAVATVPADFTPTASPAPIASPTKDLMTVAAMTQIPGPLTLLTNRGGLTDAGRYRWFGLAGSEAYEPMKEVVLRYLQIVTQKTNAEPVLDLDTQLKNVMTSSDGYQKLPGECDMSDVAWYYSIVEQPKFGPPFSRWIQDLDLATGMWTGLSPVLSGDEAYETTEITYDAKLDLVLTGVGVEFPAGRARFENLKTGEITVSEQPVAGAAKLKLVDGAWKISLTTIGCNSSDR